MGTSVRVLADSIAENGRRVTTMEWTYPRAIHSEIMTHGKLSRNAASSRAIPVEAMIQRILDDPWIPKYIGRNQKGMQAGAELNENEKELARGIWLDARDSAISHARHLNSMRVHKQVTNRLLEPWLHITIIVTAVEYNNVWALRCHEAAEPHFQELSVMAREAREASTPVVLLPGEWHVPLINIDEEDRRVLDAYVKDVVFEPEALCDPVFGWAIPKLVPVSVGRCARVSYLTHDGKRDPLKDVQLHDDLLGNVPMHASPAEHCAMALGPDAGNERHGKLVGWFPYRMMLPNEHVPG